MFFLVLLIDKKKKVVVPNKKILVPINRCEIPEHLLGSFFNGGAVGKIIPKIFYSVNKNVDANFDLQISETFVEGEDACYIGKILDCFGNVSSIG